MIIPFITPGQWYLIFQENGFWAAMEAWGISWWAIVIPLVFLLAIIGVALFVPFPGASK
ncbi:MAG: hypothetical protein WCQ69_02415 [Bacteroidales bacterium]|jgi:hypothetical protein|nr:hypothetical protein [Bacteroidales bacterium]MDD2263488.1 hypothetical protein [Bacteroidales bacterium]MDD2830722.1 hypothetical protein [Bacteroidales bacterium]MDD3207921.1 hypothetical protein [Bacteroidales bacterium]MDD3696572.1 hypothetical protein [Bacteroidales bacterium]